MSSGISKRAAITATLSKSWRERFFGVLRTADLLNLDYYFALVIIYVVREVVL